MTFAIAAEGALVRRPRVGLARGRRPVAAVRGADGRRAGPCRRRCQVAHAADPAGAAVSAWGRHRHLARIMALKLGDLLGQPIVVDNRAGASGNIATDIVAKAEPDGYTVLMGFNTALTMNPSLYKNLPFNVQRDFKPVTMLASAQYVLGSIRRRRCIRCRT